MAELPGGGVLMWLLKQDKPKKLDTPKKRLEVISASGNQATPSSTTPNPGTSNSSKQQQQQQEQERV